MDTRHNISSTLLRISTTHVPSFRNTMHNDDTKLVWYAWEMLRSALYVYMIYEWNIKIHFSWWYSAHNELKPYRKTHRLGYVNMFTANLQQYSRFNNFGVNCKWWSFKQTLFPDWSTTHTEAEFVVKLVKPAVPISPQYFRNYVGCSWVMLIHVTLPVDYV